MMIVTEATDSRDRLVSSVDYEVAGLDGLVLSSSYDLPARLSGATLLYTLDRR